MAKNFLRGGEKILLAPPRPLWLRARCNDILTESFNLSMQYPIEHRLRKSDGCVVNLDGRRIRRISCGSELKLHIYCIEVDDNPILI